MIPRNTKLKNIKNETNVMDLLDDFDKFQRNLKNKYFNIKDKWWFNMLFNIIKLSYRYWNSLLSENNDYINNISIIKTLYKDLSELKISLKKDKKYDYSLYIKNIYNLIVKNNKKLENFSNEIDKNILSKYLISKENYLHNKYDNELINELLQEEFKNYTNNIIFYGPQSSGKIQQIIFNINYFNIKNKKEQIKYIIVDDIASEAKDISVWGFEQSALERITEKLMQNSDNKKNFSKYYIILKKLSFYKNYGNDANKLKTSPINYIAKQNKISDKIRLIIVEDEVGLKNLQSSFAFKNYEQWRYINGINDDNLETINNLVQAQINAINTDKKVKVSINKETLKLINEVNNSMYTSNNIMNLAFKSSYEKFLKVFGNKVEKVENKKQLINNLSNFLNNLDYIVFELEKSLETQKFLWFYTFYKAFIESENKLNVSEEYKNFINKNGITYETFTKIYKKVIELYKPLEIYLETDYPNDKDFNEEEFDKDILAFFESKKYIKTDTDKKYIINDDLLFIFNHLYLLFDLYNNENIKLIDNYNNYDIGQRLNDRSNKLDLAFKSFDFFKFKNNNLKELMKNIIFFETDIIPKRYFKNFNSHDFDTINMDYNENYFIKIDLFKSNNKYENIFNFFIGISDQIIEEVLEKRFFYNFFSFKNNLSNDKNVLNINNDDFLYFIKKEFNNIIMPFEGKYGSIEYKKLLNNIDELNKYIKDEVIGQDIVIDELCSSLFNRYILNQTIRKPWMSYLFVGPTGVGKTKTAQMIAKKLFNDNNKFINLNMSEYSDHLSSLIDANNKLTEHLSTNPQSVILFDEIEKSSNENLNILLQILSSGSFINSYGEEISLKNSIVICTTNLNSTLFEYKRIKNNKKAWLETAKLKIKEEILGRFDNILLFNDLDNQKLQEIFVDKLNKEIENIKQNFNNQIKFETNVLFNNFLIEEIEKNGFGARGIENIINNQVLSKISNLLFLAKHKIKKIEIKIGDSIEIKENKDA